MEKSLTSCGKMCINAGLAMRLKKREDKKGLNKRFRGHRTGRWDKTHIKMDDGLIGRPQKNPGGLFFIVLPLAPFNGVPSRLCCIHFGIKSFCIFRQLLLFSPLCLPLFLCSSLSSTLRGGDDADSLGCPGPSPPWRGGICKASGTLTQKTMKYRRSSVSQLAFRASHKQVFFFIPTLNCFQSTTYSTTFWLLQFHCLPQGPSLSLSVFPVRLLSWDPITVFPRTHTN